MNAFLTTTFIFLCLNFFNSPFVAEAGEEAASPSPKAQLVARPERRVPPVETQNCFVNEAAIEDIKKSRQDNEALRKALATKETELNKREQALTEELKKLEQARDSISKIQDTKKLET